MSNDSRVYSAFISKHNKEFGTTQKYSSQHNLGEDVNFSYAYQKLRRIHRWEESDFLNPQDFLCAFRSQDTELQTTLTFYHTKPPSAVETGLGSKRQWHFMPRTDKTL